MDVRVRLSAELVALPLAGAVETSSKMTGGGEDGGGDEAPWRPRVAEAIMMNAEQRRLFVREHRTCVFAFQRLAGLIPRLERLFELDAAEGARLEEPAVIAGERHALSDNALVDDLDAHLR
jgi:hypothetical protein